MPPDLTPMERPDGLPDNYWDAEKSEVKFGDLIGALSDGKPSKMERPDGLADKYWNAETNEVNFADLNSHISDHETFKAGIESLAAQVPEDAGKYDLALPEKFELPEGAKFELDEEGFLAKGFREFAFENKLSQATVTALMELYAGNEVNDFTVQQEASAKAIEELGPRAEQRALAVDQWIDGLAGDKTDLATALKASMTSKAALEGFELIMRKATGVKLSAVPGGNPGIFNEKMTPEQRLAAANELAAAG